MRLCRQFAGFTSGLSVIQEQLPTAGRLGLKARGYELHSLV
jgi:hypothetical protein